MSDQKITYQEATMEIENIVAKIENEELDVDELASYVKRASYLLSICKAKLRKSEEELNKALEDFSK